MEVFQIEGGHKLSGSITPQGAKNEALQVLCSVLLTEEEVILENVPDIRDINRQIEILQSLGVTVKQLGKGKFSFIAKDLNLDYLHSDQFKKDGASIRGSIMIVGPLLARFRSEE